jgi:hypothetical protein
VHHTFFFYFEGVCTPARQDFSGEYAPLDLAKSISEQHPETVVSTSPSISQSATFWVPIGAAEAFVRCRAHSPPALRQY